MASTFEHLLAVDWGTSSLRGALLDADGKVLGERSFERGILSVPPGQFASVLEANFSDWLRAKSTFCMISGMAGSRQGWIEAPYCPCPAGAAELEARLAWIEPARIAIVPGVSDEHDGIPDVMRGEEMQILGALALLDIDEGSFVLPGTHSKWASVRAGRIAGFRTYMTGEFYALLSSRSILARTLDADAPLDEPAFLAGAARAQQSAELLHHAFGARTLALFGRMDAAALASYLSGLLIGDELRSQTLAQHTTVVLIGAPALTRRYALALSARDVPSTSLGSEATWAGLHRLARPFLRR